MKKQLLTASVLLLLPLAIVTGCTPAEAEPLEVTYYYLPG